MVRIAHISDTHLGNRQYGSDVRRQDFTDAFEAAVERAIEHDADAIIHTGDLFHRRTPPLPQVNQCIDILRRAADAEIPFYGIVGNHDRKMDDQWLDLIERSGTAARLGRSPTMVGDDGGDGEVALYGIDAVPSPAWESADFTLDEPDKDDAYRLLCMHQLLHPPVPEIMAEYPTESVIDRLSIDIHGLALGDYHEAVSKTVKTVDVWYAGSTEKGSIGEEGPRSITLLSEFSNGSMTREQLDLETRDFQSIEISFAEDEGYAHARDEIANYDVTDKVAVIRLSGKRTSLTASDVHEIALDRGAAVARVDDNRGREHLDIGEAPSTEVEDPDTLIDQRLADAGLSEPALEAEALVRDETTATNALDDAATELITEAQDAAFSGEEPPEAVLSDGPKESTESENGKSADEEPAEPQAVEEGPNAEATQDPTEDVNETESTTEGAIDAQSSGEGAVRDDAAESASADGGSEESDTTVSGGADTTSQASFADLNQPEAESDADADSDADTDADAGTGGESQ